MLAKTRVVKVLFFILLGLALVAGQSGCGSTSENAGSAAGGSAGDTPRLALSTTTGSTAIVADGRSTLPIRMQVTSSSGAPMVGVSVTFATDAGTLSEAAVVRSVRAQEALETLPGATRITSEGRVTVSTDSTGIAQVFLTSSIVAGFATVTADVTSRGQNFRTNIVISFVAGAAARVQLGAMPTSLGAGGTATLTATVTDTNGNRVPGATLMFSLTTNTSGAMLSAASSATDSNGQATVTYEAGFIAGADTVQAQVSGGVVGTTSITVTPTPGGTVTNVVVASGAMDVVADGASSVLIRATVMGAAGLLPGIPVAFTTTAGRLSAAMATTDAGGVASVSLIAATSLGTATVTANAEGVTNTEVVNFVAGPPARVTLSASPLAVNAMATAMVQATVVDANDNPVAGQTLVFSLPTNSSGATLSALTGTTDANGQFTIMYTAGATLGMDIVQARATNGSVGSVPLTVAVRTAGVASVTATTGAASIVANGMATAVIRATVRDATMTGVSGIVVSFNTTAGTVTATAMTDSNGVATATLTASRTIGTAMVTAAAGGLVGTTSVMFVAGPPASPIRLLATPLVVAPGATAVIRAMVMDANGNPTAMQTLTFALTTNASGATLGVLTGVTDASGQFSVVYTAGATLGMDSVQARTASGAEGMVTLTVANQMTNVSMVTVTAGATMLVADGSSRTAIRATVSDAAGAGLPNVEVAFATTAGMVSAPMAVTGPDGTATVDLIAASSLGMATVTATASGFSGNVMVMFVAGPPETVVVTTTATAVNIRGTSMLQVTVRDANGNPTAMQTVTLSFVTNASGAALSLLTGATNASGQLPLITYTAGQIPGTDMVSARTVNGRTNTPPLSIIVMTGTGANPSTIDLLVSSPQLNSGGMNSVALTALARDATNNVVSGATVNFAASSGSIQVVNSVTDAAGRATAMLMTGGDPTNRTITVTATTGTLSDINTVEVTGTTLSVSGPSSLVLNSPARLSILLRDSTGVGIANRQVTLQSMLGNPLIIAMPGDPPTATMCPPIPATPATVMVTTDSTGGALVDVTACFAGMDTITAMALGVVPTPEHQLSVSEDDFRFTMPALGAQVQLGTPQDVIVQWTVGNNPPMPLNGRTINFSATRGMLSAPNAITGPDGIARVTIMSSQAGPAIITASVTDGPSAQVSIDFFATTPSSLILQASPTTLGVNAVGSAAQQSVITAIVQDTNSNPVKNQAVNFSLTDTTGGSIFPASAITDSFGRSSTLYTSGAVPSAQNGVIIDAAIPNFPGVINRVRLTVAQQALFVTLGTGNLIQTPTNTQYAKPYSVLVTDANGNPVANASVEITVLATRYEKGCYVPITPEGGSCRWAKFVTIDSADLADLDNADQACDNEDINHNGILDVVPLEDHNFNNILDPGNVAAVPGSARTNESGFAFFDVVYAREFTWVEVVLQARATVAGSEGLSSTTFFLPGLADDFTNCLISPPGIVSPYGRATTCICDELVNPNCPINQVICPNP